MRTLFYMPTKRTLCCTFVGAAITLAVGCSEESSEPVSTDNVEVIEPIATPGEEAPSADEPVELIEPELEPDLESEQVEYAPPYPNRTNLFEPPHRANRVASSSSGDNADRVVLMGFANLGTPKVVLEIDGIVTPLADGDEQAGV